MSIDTILQATTPSALPALDHHLLQRRGRRRRRVQQAATGTAALGAAGAVGIAAFLARPAGVPPEAGLVELDVAAAERPTLEADELANWEDLTYDQALDRLVAVLDEHPTRPHDLAAIVVVETGTRTEVRAIESGVTEFAIPTVNDLEFQVDGHFEVPSLLPAWTQAAARKALMSLRMSDEFRYAGPSQDAQGRDVLVFAGMRTDQQIHIDPATGYTSGVRSGRFEAVAPEDLLEEGLPLPPAFLEELEDGSRITILEDERGVTVMEWMVPTMPPADAPTEEGG